MNSDAGRHIRIGMASVSITPDRNVQLIGQFHQRISTHVHDQITATALALEGGNSGGDGVIVVSCDLVCVPASVQERVRRAFVAKITDVDAPTLFMAATHTHTAPCVPAILDYPEAPDGVLPMADYVEFLVERVAGVAADAWRNRQPGALSWTTGHAALGYNRRVMYSDGHVEMYGDTRRGDFLCLEGAEDHAVELIYIWNQANALVGVVINPACPSQVAEGKSFVSADFWAAARSQLRQIYGEGLEVLALTSACGDQSPRDMVRRGRGEVNDMRDETGLEELGKRIAEMVRREYPQAQLGIRRNVELRHVCEKISLPVRMPTEKEWDEAAAALSRLEAQNPAPGTNAWGQMRHWRNAMDRFKQRARNGDSEFEMELHVVRIGEIAICTNPFELFLDFGLQMKARSRAQQTFVVELACDAGGYVPTERAVQGGSYGAMIWNGEVGPAGGAVLVERTVAAIDALFPESVPEAPR